jgi:formate dehydrogenase subunit delta
MNTDLLVKMVNEISAFFAGESAPEQAPRDIATHLKRFWDPRMRREILAHLAKGGAGLSDLGLRAVSVLAAESAAAAKGRSASHG